MIQIYDKTSVRLKKARHLKLVQPIIDIADTLVIISNRVDNGFMVIRFNKNNVFAPGIFEQFFRCRENPVSSSQIRIRIKPSLQNSHDHYTILRRREKDQNSAKDVVSGKSS